MAGRSSFAVGPDEGPDYAGSPELALVALMALMSRFPSRATPALAHAVVAHLRVIGEEARLDARISECARALITQWEALAILSEAPAEARPAPPYCPQLN
jgi:hypothetical protein